MQRRAHTNNATAQALNCSCATMPAKASNKMPPITRLECATRQARIVSSGLATNNGTPEWCEKAVKS